MKVIDTTHDISSQLVGFIIEFNGNLREAQLKWNNLDVYTKINMGDYNKIFFDGLYGSVSYYYKVRVNVGDSDNVEGEIIDRIAYRQVNKSATLYIKHRSPGLFWDHDEYEVVKTINL